MYPRVKRLPATRHLPRKLNENSEARDYFFCEEIKMKEAFMSLKRCVRPMEREKWLHNGRGSKQGGPVGVWLHDCGEEIYASYTERGNTILK